ncbi:MAG: hypothetical protein K8R21_08995, partial [Leptospira sp.]|nr:hypothetical protein [Leptospira sp.]
MAGSYYKKIKGKNYDKELLDLAEFSVRGAGDGRISLDDAEKILDKVKDANEYTEIEKRTIHYIRDHFKFTKQSDAWFRKEIRSWAATKKSSKLSRKTPKQEPVRSSEEEWPILAQQVRVESRQNENKKKLRKTILVLLIAILLALGLYFLFSNFFCRKDSVEKVEKENSTSKPGVLSTSETKKEA